MDHDGDGVREKVSGPDTRMLAFTLISSSSSEEWRTIASQLAESWRKVGVRVRIEAMETNALSKRIKAREFDAYLSGLTDDWEYDPRGLFHSSLAAAPDAQNYVGYRNPALDTLIEAYEGDMDETSRLDTCHRIHRMLHEDEPYLYLFSKVTPVLWWDGLNDVDRFPDVPNRDVRYQSFARLPGSP